MAELTTAFNSMAERVQASIEYIRRDRDRSRDFLADVSHELKTPIAALRTFNELLTEGQVKDEATREGVPRAERASRSSGSTGWPPTCSSCPSSNRASSCSTCGRMTCAPSSKAPSSRPSQRPSARTSRLVAVLPKDAIRQRHDPQRMGQVLDQPDRQCHQVHAARRRVRVTLEPTTEGAELRVVDTGVGINSTELPYVFERFYRGAEAHESRAAGSGLGLSIVRSIVEMHNGRVSISSTPGKGTEVAVASAARNSPFLHPPLSKLEPVSVTLAAASPSDDRDGAPFRRALSQQRGVNRLDAASRRDLGSGLGRHPGGRRA